MSIAIFVELALVGCSPATPAPASVEPSRPFALGFSDFPYAASQEGFAVAYQTIARDGVAFTNGDEPGVKLRKKKR